MPLEPFYERYKRDCRKTHQDYAGFKIFYGVIAKISGEERSVRGKWRSGQGSTRSNDQRQSIEEEINYKALTNFSITLVL